MAVKILSSPFVTFLFPLPDGSISDEDRAQLAVGYPLAAIVPVPPTPTPEVTPEILRVPSLIPTPQTYYDELVGEIPELYLWIREVIWEEVKAIAGVGLWLDDRQLVTEMVAVIEDLSLSIWDCLKGMEAPVARAFLSGQINDKLKFSAYRKHLILHFDESLGIK